MRPAPLHVLGVLTAAALLAFVGCKKQAEKKPGELLIGFSSRDMSAEYTARLSEAVVAHGKTLPGVKVIMVDAQADAQRQISQVENFISQKVDAIVLNPCEFEASAPAVERAKAAGIPIVIEPGFRSGATAGGVAGFAADGLAGLAGERVT